MAIHPRVRAVAVVRHRYWHRCLRAAKAELWTYSLREDERVEGRPSAHSMGTLTQVVR